MSITLITGVPGSGKTLYAVTELLQPLIGSTVDRVLEDGGKESIKRVLYSNINGLLLEHELIIGNGEWKRNPGKPVEDQWSFEGENTLGLHNWHEWAKPGSVICFDEFQKSWPPRPNGAPIPPDIQALDTHRHMGVDFILPTQKCNNFDRHILGLVDRHLHVRRVAGMPLAVIYEWDHASPSLLFKNAMTKGAWRFKKWGYKLYKSAEVHTKMKRKMPALVWVILIALAGSAFAIPTLVKRLNERTSSAYQSKLTGKPDEKTQPVASLENGVLTTSAVSVTEGSPSPLVSDLQGPSLLPGFVPPPRVLAGCVSVADRCACVDALGEPIEVEPGFCEAKILGNSRPGQKADISALPAGPDGVDRSSDAEIVSFMRR